MVECLGRMEGGKCMAFLSVSNHKSAYATKQNLLWPSSLLLQNEEQKQCMEGRLEHMVHPGGESMVRGLAPASVSRAQGGRSHCCPAGRQHKGKMLVCMHYLVWDFSVWDAVIHIHGWSFCLGSAAVDSSHRQAYGCFSWVIQNPDTFIMMITEDKQNLQR